MVGKQDRGSLDTPAPFGSLGVTTSGFLSSEREINLSYLSH